MRTIRIDSVDLSKSGKSLTVKMGGDFYLAKLDSGLLGKQGQTIEAEVETSEHNGKEFIWIKKYSTGQNGGSAAPQQQNVSHGTSSGAAPWWAPMCSNVVAHAIQAGQCTTPDQVANWAGAVKEWAEGRTEPF